jgi:hypothetical protein
VVTPPLALTFIQQQELEHGVLIYCYFVAYAPVLVNLVLRIRKSVAASVFASDGDGGGLSAGREVRWWGRIGWQVNTRCGTFPGQLFLLGKGKRDLAHCVGALMACHRVVHRQPTSASFYRACDGRNLGIFIYKFSVIKQINSYPTRSVEAAW